MALFRPLRPFLPISTLVLKKPQLIRKGNQQFQPKIKLSPFAWNFGKTLVTSRLSLKSDKSKSSDNQNENEIAENQEIEEVDISLILANPETNRYVCPFKSCSKSFARRWNLERHINGVHLDIRPYKCEYENCSESFHTRHGLETHINGVHLNLRPYKCDYEDCSESFQTQASLDKHKAAIHAKYLKLLECPECDEKFKHSKELENYIKSFHTVTDHQCPHCKKYLKGNLNRHIDRCLKIKKHKCPKCEDKFVTQGDLNLHMARKHSDKRNYICDFKGCGKAFKTQSDLSNHKKSHSDKKPLKCPYCPKEYKRFSNLRTHVYKKHPEEYKEENDPKIEE